MRRLSSIYYHGTTRGHRRLNGGGDNFSRLFDGLIRPVHGQLELLDLSSSARQENPAGGRDHYIC